MKKIIPDIGVEEFLGFEEEVTTRVSEIAKVIKDIPRGEDVDSDNICERLNCDIGEQGYEQLTDDQIVDKVKGGGDGKGSESEEEGETAAPSSASTKTTVTHGAALANFESLLEYVETQDGASTTEIIVYKTLEAK